MSDVVNVSDRFGRAMRRLRMVAATADILVELMKSGTSGRAIAVAEHALPADATLFDMRIDVNVFGMIYIVVESATFDPVADGQPIPMHPNPLFVRAPCV